MESYALTLPCDRLLLGDGLGAYRSHSWGAVDFFQAAGPKFCQGEFEAALFHAVSGSAWLKALVAGESSGFDDDEWLAVKSPSALGTPTSDLESSALTRAMLLLPRLIKLVRELRSDPESIMLASDAVTVAETLLQSYQNLAEAEVPTIAKLCPAAADSPLPYSVHFPDPQIANATIYARHWSLRILIACLCRSLPTTQQPRAPHWPSPEDEHRAARLICATIPQTTSKYPHTASSALFPLQVAYGPLWRAYECDPSNYKAERMVEWIEARINDAGAYIGAQTNREQMRALTAVFEGRTRWEF